MDAWFKLNKYCSYKYLFHTSTGFTSDKFGTKSCDEDGQVISLLTLGTLYWWRNLEIADMTSHRE